MGRARGASALLAVAAALIVVGSVAVAVAQRAPDSGRPPAPTTTTTAAPARERAQAGWAVVSASARGVMVDTRSLEVGGAAFRVLRLRARTTLLRWHVGLGDPTDYARAPADAGPSVDWGSEGRAGVVAAFNGGFKENAGAGGEMADGVVLVPPVAGDMTIALDAAGHWAMGVWGAPGFPPAGFAAVSYRQNLRPLVLGGRPTALASAPFRVWGDPLHEVPLEPRTGLGVDAAGNLIDVATMDPVDALQVAQALVAAGAVRGMQLDINPFWPIQGAASHPRHRATGDYAVELPGATHSALVYDTGWIRDFFVALAEPDAWSCAWRSPGLGPGGAARPQPLREVCAGPRSRGATP